MKFHSMARWFAFAAAAWPLRADDDLLDRLDQTLSISSTDGALRARVSGTLDLEAYGFSQPAPALIDAEGTALFNPRLTTFVDVQAGSFVYAFAQVRVDRGFDPAADPLRVGLDEFALRVTPWLDGRASVQVGKFATVVGNWVARHGSWDNPFISAPLPYENQTGVWDSAAARSGVMLLSWAHVRPRHAPDQPATDKYQRLPVIWGPSYVPGVSVSGTLGRIDYAAELKSASLSSRPSVWDDAEFHWIHPTVSARLGYRPNMMWNVGASASAGSYLTAAAAPTVPAGLGRGDYREIVLGQDVSFAWHHFQLWAEAFESRFEIPRLGNADTWSYYVEVRYKFTPRFAGAVRWNEQFFGKVPDGFGGRATWGADLWRIEVAPSFRFTPHVQLKLQYGVEHDPLKSRTYSPLAAAQFVMRF